MRAGTGSGPRFGRGRRSWLAAWTAAALPLAALPLAALPAAGQARAAASLPDCTASAMTVTCAYTASGTFDVPGRVTSIHVVAAGGHGVTGRGGGKLGGPGAQVTANLSVTPGQTLLVEVDVGGGTGGRTNPSWYGGDGGGKSAVGTAQDPRLVVAGGGGGGGGYPQGGEGGAAGGADPGTCHPGTDGHDGTHVPLSGYRGEGGGCAGGGAGGMAGSGGEPGTAGTATSGGGGGHVGLDGGGGGGAGYFGGGGAGSSGLNGGGGGGGGSSFGPAGSVFAAATTGPRVVISYRAQHAITIDKLAEPATFTAAGDVIHYTYTVTNTGHATLHDITVHDTVIGPIHCPETTLDPGRSMRCTASFTITQEDVDRGSVTNAAIVTGLDPTDKPETDEAEATATVPGLVPVTG